MFAKDVFRIVSGVLQDLEPGIEQRWRWEGGDDNAVGLLDFLNLAVSEVAMQRPDATATSGNIRLEAGAWQRVPVAALTFIGCNYNVDEDGRTQGQPVVCSTPDTLMAWGGAGLSCIWRGVEAFAYDRMTDPRRFMVYPEVPDGCDAIVNATWAARPQHVENADDCVCLPDTYQAALVHHVLYSVLSGDNEASNAAKAQHHLSVFYQALGVKMNTDMTWPKSRNGGGGQ